MWSQQESNLHCKFRKLKSYPLNDETILYISYWLLEVISKSISVQLTQKFPSG